MRRALLRMCLSLSVWCGLVLGREARASEPPPASVTATAGPSVVDLAVVGDERTARVIVPRIESWFRGNSTTTRLTRMDRLPSATVFAPADHAGVRVWVVLHQPVSASVFFAVQERVGRAPRYLVTEVPFEGGLDEIATERLGEVVYLSAMALWAGDVESTPREVEAQLGQTPGQASGAPPARPRPTPPTPPPRKDTPSPKAAVGRSALQLQYDYSARWAGPEGVAQTLSATLAAIRERPSLELGGRLHVGALLPRELTASGVQVDLQGVTFGLGAVASQQVATRVWAPAEIGVGLDVVLYRTAAVVGPSLRPSAGGIDARPLVFARYGVEVLAGTVRLGVDALLDVQLLRAHYDLADGGRRVALIVPWVVEPGVAGTVSW